MKRNVSFASLLVAGLLALFLTACSDTSNTNSNLSNTNANGNANANNANLTAGNANLNANASNTNSLNANEGSAALPEADRKFATDAAQGGEAEVEMGKLATEHAKSPEVKKFGQRMVDDHTKANDELMSVARSKNITLPKEISAAEKEDKDRLAKLSGEQFDKAYMDDMVKDHTKDVADFEREATSGSDKEIKAFAQKTLTVIQGHLRMAQELAPKENKEAKTDQVGKKS